eukprot:3705718-Pyramimonas_sp.AAC.1
MALHMPTCRAPASSSHSSQRLPSLTSAERSVTTSFTPGKCLRACKTQCRSAAPIVCCTPGRPP